MTYFISSRWRNKEIVEDLTQKLRAKGAEVLSFFEKEGNIMDGTDPEGEMKSFEERQDWKTDPQIKKIFHDDINLVRSADAYVLLLPAGNSSHIEAGIAYEAGKKMICVGNIEKAETNYLIFDEFFETAEDFVNSIGE